MQLAVRYTAQIFPGLYFLSHPKICILYLFYQYGFFTVKTRVFINPVSLTIHGKSGSYAEEYAKDESIKFVAE